MQRGWETGSLWLSLAEPDHAGAGARCGDGCPCKKWEIETQTHRERLRDDGGRDQGDEATSLGRRGCPRSQPANTLVSDIRPLGLGRNKRVSFYVTQFVALGHGGQGQAGRQRLSWPGWPRRMVTGEPACFPALQNL